MTLQACCCFFFAEKSLFYLSETPLFPRQRFQRIPAKWSLSWRTDPLFLARRGSGDPFRGQQACENLVSPPVVLSPGPPATFRGGPPSPPCWGTYRCPAKCGWASGERNGTPRDLNMEAKVLFRIVWMLLEVQGYLGISGLATSNPEFQGYLGTWA